MKFTVTSQAGLALGEYDERAPIIRLEQGRPHPRMKRPLDLAPGGETVVDYPLEGAYRTLTATVRRVDETDAEQPRPSPAPSRPRVVEVERPARNIGLARAGMLLGEPPGTVTSEMLAFSRATHEVEQPARNVTPLPARTVPKPPGKAEAPPVSATRRRVVRKTP